VTLVLSRTDVLDLLSLPECIDAVERAFRLHAEGHTLGPGVLSVHAAGGGFHIKAAGLIGERSYFAAKTNANFSDNPRRWGLPTIQGTIVLADAVNGTPLAVMDSASVTALRTGAATAVAAKFLARPDASTATVVGCGVQGDVQLAAVAAVLPLRRILLVDIDHTRAEDLAARAAARHGVRVEPAKDLRSALRASDVCVTCTTSGGRFSAPEMSRPEPSLRRLARTTRRSRSSSLPCSLPRPWWSTSSINAPRSVSCTTPWRPA